MVAYNDRVLAIARNGAGKSVLLNVLFSAVRCQRLLVDPKDEFSTRDDAGEPVPRVTAVDALDWSQRTLHVVPRGWDRAEWEELFAACWRPGRPLTLALHEAGYACEFRPGSVGPHHNTYISQGRAHGLGYYAASQRPACLPTFAVSEPGHVFAFAEKLSRDDDHKALATAMDLPPRELADAQRELLSGDDLETARHGFLWFNRSTGQLTAWPPLPAELRNRSCVESRSVA